MRVLNPFSFQNKHTFKNVDLKHLPAVFSSPGTSPCHTYQVDYDGSRAPIGRFCYLSSLLLNYCEFCDERQIFKYFLYMIRIGLLQIYTQGKGQSSVEDNSQVGHLCRPEPDLLPRRHQKRIFEAIEFSVR